MGDNMKEKVSALSERLKTSGTEVGRRVSAGMSSLSFKMKEFFQGQNMADKIVDEATSESMEGPDWSTNLEISDMINTGRANSIEVIRAIKRRIMLKNPKVQYLALVLLESVVKNCEKAFSEVAAERVLDEMIKLIEDPQTVVNNRSKALVLIEAWGESTDQLQYLPVYEETYKSLKSRGIRFPGRDDESLAPIFTPPRSVPDAEVYDRAAHQYYNEIPDYVMPSHRQHPREMPSHSFTAQQTQEAFDSARNTSELLSTLLSASTENDGAEDELTTTLVQQCKSCQHVIQMIIETMADNEMLLFEALSINDELQKVITKYEEMKQPVAVHSAPEPALIPVSTETDASPPAITDLGASAPTPFIVPVPPHAMPDGEKNVFDDLDAMIFGKGSSASHGHEPKKQ